MPPRPLLKYILDVEAVIEEIEQIIEKYGNNFKEFNKDFIAKRAVERQLEIIGEAVNAMRRIEPNIRITGAKHIVALRNLIIHSYDAVDPEILWGIIQKDIPVLKAELQELRQ